MNLTLQRLVSSDEGTFGVLIVEAKPSFVTLELPWKNNQRKISCIPVGVYHAVKMFSEKFSRFVYVLQDVPGRDLIEFHIGNLLKDTEGCILLGISFGLDLPMISHSVTAFDRFMLTMPPEGFTITVKDVVV